QSLERQQPPKLVRNSSLPPFKVSQRTTRSSAEREKYDTAAIIMPAVVDACEAHKERRQASPFIEHQVATPIKPMMSKPPAHTVMAATVAM
ncbi:hypothetical protein, partial [Streptomyces sp. P17]|uniref:hypothetical protein n=1 Tax=Streptomyces sp. P17 TaxID=3074716 RepID=UPI0028F40B22